MTTQATVEGAKLVVGDAGANEDGAAFDVHPRIDGIHLAFEGLIRVGVHLDFDRLAGVNRGQIFFRYLEVDLDRVDPRDATA